ncbi:muramoylpentapeptide carboxypeptidase [Streptomyces gougerotii]|uniref:Muramoylpentapeptide carboxypeptidase n=4 Tax=Streptomyces TaxID=1883 RepID=A0A8H9LW18_9ACTN|nr:muramoylpentapeptide carboxypeptidase [Streptomyces rutgersensis]GFH74417.1 muramoylpentapeptide carboxypeptidase [Streptomyces diastaticus subsp. diastaticus]GFH76690.1 muramoylpentapeptide carboxypeptidase [Streptomyces gougerotii]GGU02821.1 muramoylpentapeptide carboxypeptidase [Streptomyces diastaticus subsp. diastaticus]GGU88008.1 muramoylpentapeptide carboxypeptidase [Streptomyces gougerotii]
MAPHMRSRPIRLLLSALMGAGLAFAPVSAVAAPTATAPAAKDVGAADGCYTWSGTLSEGSSGEAVRQLQIRVAGYPGTGSQIAIDGQFGPATKAAVQRFQSAYGLAADGVAGPATFSKIYQLQDDDCTPVNFTYAELNRCNSDWSGGKVSAATARANALVTMWKLQAMRHAMGDKPITVNGGFRSVTCNSNVGGATNSRHLYGHAADLGAGSQGFCALAKAARNHGFTEILGPGYPGHDDHTHVAGGGGRFWSAPSCGI